MSPVRSLDEIKSNTLPRVVSEFKGGKHPDLFRTQGVFSEILSQLKTVIDGAKNKTLSDEDQRQLIQNIRIKALERLREINKMGEGKTFQEIRQELQRDPQLPKGRRSERLILQNLIEQIDDNDLTLIPTIESLIVDFFPSVNEGGIDIAEEKVREILKKISDFVELSKKLSKDDQIAELYNLNRYINSQLIEVETEISRLENNLIFAERIKDPSSSQLKLQVDKLKKSLSLIKGMQTYIDSKDLTSLKKFEIDNIIHSEALAMNEKLDIEKEEEKIRGENKLIDTSRNLWASFVETFDLGETKEDQLHSLLEMIITEATEKYWEKPLSKEASTAPNWYGWAIGTLDGNTRTLQQILNTIPDNDFKKEIEDRINVLVLMFEGGHNWYQVYDNGSPGPIIEHFDKYLLAGTDLQSLKELGYRPHGVDFFDVMGQGIAEYITWNDKNVYLTDSEWDDITNSSESDLLSRVGITSLPSLHDFEKYINFQDKTITDINGLKKLVEDGLKGAIEISMVVAIAVETILTQSDSSQEQFFHQRLIVALQDYLIQKEQKKKALEFGIFPQKEVGDSEKKLDPVTKKPITQTEFYRKKVVQRLEKYIAEDLNMRRKILEDVVAKLINDGNPNPSASQIKEAYRVELTGLAEQAEMIAFITYNAQGYPSKDDEILQRATNKLWRQFATAWYRSKYPAMEGAEDLKGTIFELDAQWMDYSSVSITISGKQRAVSLREAWINPELRQAADFTISDQGVRNTYVNRGLRLGNEIYELLVQGLGFDIWKIAEYKQSGDISDRTQLVFNQEIVEKIASIDRSKVGYHVDAYCVPSNTSDGIQTVHDGWTPVIVNGRPVAYSLLLDTRMRNGVDHSMINVPDRSQFINEVVRLGGNFTAVRNAFKKWFMSVLFENHLLIRSGLAYVPDDDIIGATVALSGQLPMRADGKPVYHRFSNISNKSRSPEGLNFQPDEVLKMIDQSVGTRPRIQAVLHAILTEGKLID